MYPASELLPRTMRIDELLTVVRREQSSGCQQPFDQDRRRGGPRGPEIDRRAPPSLVGDFCHPFDRAVAIRSLVTESQTWTPPVRPFVLVVSVAADGDQEHRH